MLSAESLTAKKDAVERALERDWFQNNKEVHQYGDLLIDVIVRELPDIRGKECDPDGQYRANLMTVDKTMVAELKRDGRREPNYAVDW